VFLVFVFCMQISSFPSKFVEKAVFSPLFVLGTFVRNQEVVAVWIHIWVFYSVLLIFLTISTALVIFEIGSYFMPG
jgi:hypothetical protein